MTSRELNLKPQRLSQLYHKQTSLDAKFIQDQNGWIRPERFSDPNDEKTKTARGIGIYDISHLTKLSMKTDDIIEIISSLYDQSFSRGALLVNGPGSLREAICAILSDDEALFIANPSSNEAISKQLSSGSGKYQTTDVSSVFGGLYVLGGKSRAIMSKLTELNVNPENFPNLTSTHASLHHVQCVVLRFDLGNLTGYQLYFERAYGEYVWDIIFHAGKEFDVIPVGSSAIDLLGWGLG